MTAEIIKWWRVELIQLTNLEFAFNGDDDIVRVRYAIVDYNKDKNHITGYETHETLSLFTTKSVIEICNDVLEDYIEKTYDHEVETKDAAG